MALADLFKQGSNEVDGVDVVAGKRQDNPIIEGGPPVNANVQGLTSFNPPPMDTPEQTSAPRSPSPPMNYDNSEAQSALMDVVRGMKPDGGSANPGIYGLLPKNLQHGTLRNVLGALGDAFLVQSDHPATYAPHMQRQQIGLAMAGLDPNDPQSVQAAIQRVAATGAPDSIELADKMQKNFSDTEVKKQAAASNQLYRQSMTESRQDMALQRMIPNIGAMVRNTKTKDQYTAAFQRAEAIAQRIGPDYHATDFGLVEPENWTQDNSQTAGLTSNNLLTSEDKGKQRRTSERGQDLNYRGRVDAASVGAQGRIASTGISVGKSTDATILQGLIDKQNGGEELTPAEQYTFNHMTQVAHRPRVLPNAVKPKASGGEPASAPGSARVVTNGDVALLKQHINNPKAKAQFDDYFGKGAAAKYLGK